MRDRCRRALLRQDALYAREHGSAQQFQKDTLLASPFMNNVHEAGSILEPRGSQVTPDTKVFGLFEFLDYR